ncbi:MAG: hypothetical protein KJ624_00950 [Chloroflexi bacterium]|nr:hypothetical protein [Chloroflexota bacterium]
MKGKFPRLFKLAMALALVVGLVPIMAAPASAAVTAVTAAPTPNTVSDNAQYTIGFTTADGVGLGGTITVTFPSGTTVPATISKNSISINGVLLTLDPSVVGRAVTMQPPVAIALGASPTIVFSQLAGILNPNLGTTTATLSVATGTESAVNSAAYTIVRTLSRSPSSGVRGTSTAVSGKGFAPATTANVRLQVTSGTDTAGAGAWLTDATKNFLSTGVSPLSVAVGDTVINTTDGSLAVITAVTATTLAGTLTGGTANVWALGNAYRVLRASTLGSGLVASDGTFTASSFAASVGPFVAGSNTLVVIDGSGLASLTTTSFTVSAKITLNPASGKPGDTITVTTQDFRAAGPNIATITFEGSALATTIPPLPIAHVLGAATFTFVVPQATAGDKNVIVGDNQATPLTATTKFTVTGIPIVASPASGVIGNTVTLTGSGYPGVNIPIGSIQFGGQPWNNNVVTISGGQFATTLNLSNTGIATVESAAATPGTYTITVVDNTGFSGTASYTVAARSITVTPDSSAMGSSIVIRGVGFPANRIALISYGAAGGIGTGLIDNSGNFAGAVVVPTGLTPGTQNTVTASSTTAAATTVTATATHSIPAGAVTLSVSSANPGSTVRVSGTGFPSYSQVAFLTIGGLSALPLPSPATDGVGSFSANVLVPALPVGPTIVVVTVGTVTGTTLVTITTTAITPGTALAGIAGKYTRVWGYNAATKAHLLYDPAVPAISDLTALARGQGYWINCTEAVTLVYGANQYVLVPGWNLIGWLD